MDKLGIEVLITTNVVTTEYQIVDVDNFTLHIEMAQKYYQAGTMNVMFVTFTEEKLLGHISLFPWQVTTDNVASAHAIIHSSPAAVGAQNNTIAHEIGHMLGKR